MRRLTLTALALALSATAAAADTARAPWLYARWDTDRSGTLSLYEIKSQSRAIFALFDVNDDGVLDRAEAKAFDQARASVGYFRGEGAYERKVLMRALKLMRNDLDGDGVIDRAEFRLGATEWLAMLDRDGSGRLTLYDVATR